MLRAAAGRTILFGRKKLNHALYGSCAVLLYHRVTSLETDPQLLSVSPQHFDEHLSLLKKKFHLLGVEEFHHCLTSKKKFPEKSVLLTFDDGYADNLLEAAPLLEKHNAEALFYIATGTLNTPREFWWDEIERIILLSGKGENREIVIEGISINPSDTNSSARHNIYNNLLPALRKLPGEKRNKLIDELAIAFQSAIPRSSHRALTFDELRTFSKSTAVVIGAHTHYHASLGSLNAEEQIKEITLSKEILERELSTAINYFSYPFGTVNDFNAISIDTCIKAGFKSVAANIPALVRSNSGLYNFPRYLVRNWNASDFTVHLNSFFKS